ncbi:type I restriction endonuclease, partial [Escherichia coli]|uniref:type I restriction endonuclease n=2 Tax=Pseudomonadota TaxID=1224 RepID=UPI0028DF0567
QPTVPLVDWQTPDTNQWDAVESPELHTTIGAHPRRPGVLGYVNGLPLVVIEGPASGGHPHAASVHEAIQRQLHHQRPD